MSHALYECVIIVCLDVCEESSFYDAHRESLLFPKLIRIQQEKLNYVHSVQCRPFVQQKLCMNLGFSRVPFEIFS
jgi:hypothetical protein